jgi:hypothetical protein
MVGFGYVTLDAFCDIVLKFARDVATAISVPTQAQTRALMAVATGDSYVDLLSYDCAY